ncbi:MAG: glycosyltransferase [Thermoplasmata archaeon]
MEKIIRLNEVKNPVISIIVPTLNEEKYIENTLLSLKWQNFKLPYEIIVSDSNSKDKTIKIAKKYADVIIISDKKGVSVGRNLRARIAKAEILLFVDADTILLPNALKEIYEFLKKKEYVGANIVVLSDNLKYNFHYIAATIVCYLLNKINAHPVYAVCLACRKKEFMKVGGFNEKLHVAEDIDLGERLKKLGRIGYLTNTFAISSARRLNKWGVFKTIAAWPLGYFLIKFFNKQPSYDPIR